MIDDSIITQFIQTISNEADRNKDNIEKTTEKFVENELGAAEKTALNDSYNYIRHEVSEIRSEMGKILNEKRNECNERLYKKRDAIFSETFEAVEKKLYAFTASADYIEFLKNSLKTIMANQNFKNAVILMRSEDNGCKEQLSALFPNCVFEEDNTIRLGGIKVCDKEHGVTADDTLDSRLEAQKNWFFENSGLIISKKF